MSQLALPEDKSLLIVDDDRPFRERLARAMQLRGFLPCRLRNERARVLHRRDTPPAFAVVDLKLEDGNGLDVLETLHDIRPNWRVVVLTGFGNIATAVAAVKFGAVDYLSKPADADDILAALMAVPGSKPKPPEIRCRPIACAGSISSASTNCAATTSRKPRAGSTCIAAPCSASSPSAARARAQSGEV